MPENVFVGPVAATYDRDHAERFAATVLDPVLDRLEQLAAGGRALELAIGTGRVALPLRDRSVDVAGIELSADMVRELRAKPGGAGVEVVLGDMADARVPGEFRLVFLVFSTITNLTSQAEQVACFANAAAHLEPGGHFVVEVGVPPLQRLPVGERFVAFAASDEHVGVDEVDVVSQRMVSHHVRRIDGEVRRFSAGFRYVWPSELDLMAQLAGLELVERSGDWAGGPFTATSRSHVSVWRRPATTT